MVVDTLASCGSRKTTPKTVSCVMNYDIRCTTRDEVSSVMLGISKELSNKLILLSALAQRITVKAKRRHPDAPRVPTKHNGMGWCVDVNQSIAIEPPVATAEGLHAVAMRVFDAMWLSGSAPMALDDLRGLGLTAITKVSLGKDSKLQGVLKFATRNNKREQEPITCSEEEPRCAKKKRKSLVIDVDALDEEEEREDEGVADPSFACALSPEICDFLRKKDYVAVVESVRRLRNTETYSRIVSSLNQWTLEHLGGIFEL